MKTSFEHHITELLNSYAQLFESCSKQGPAIDRLLIHSGSNNYYHGDDQAIPFRAFGHFCHWLPINQPDQMVLIEPGQRPIYFQVISRDYWYDQSIEQASWWSARFEVISLASHNEIGRYLKGRQGTGFIGQNSAFASELGLEESLINPTRLLHGLDYRRAYKSAYEIEQIKNANARALLGHKAARACFENGGSEYEIHMAYLLACNIREEDCPYPNIVAVDDKAAILHYQKKRHGGDSSAASQVLLLDGGCRTNNYCSDITRTSTRENTHPLFQSLTREMEKLQQSLVALVRPGMNYLQLHESALERLNDLLLDHDIIRCDRNQSLELGLPSLFMPHGVGHLLGIQVHDVGGHLANAEGEKNPPPAAFPYLRNTRTMAENMVFTIEPGLYFIPLLLDPEKASERRAFFNWTLIDELRPCGGIRIEDNIRVGSTTAENLTRC